MKVSVLENKATALLYLYLYKLPSDRDWETEIIDFILDNDIGFSSTTMGTNGWVALWERSNYKDISELKFDTELVDLRSAFREVVSQAIHNQQL